MKYICPELCLELIVDDTLLYHLIQHGKKHLPNEFGGVLLGRYSQDLTCCIVEETVLPQSYRSSCVQFERGNKGLAQELLAWRKKRPEMMYVGEWHTHPKGVPLPSNRDKTAMKEIADAPQVKVTAPILLILGYQSTKASLGAYIQMKNRLYAFEPYEEGNIQQ